MLDRVVLALGTGLFTGFVPGRVATVGSLLGIPLAYGLYVWLGWSWYLPAVLVLCFAGIWICGQSERILGREDPREVVYDEIATIPLVYFLVPDFSWPVIVAGFTLHRIFDITKILGVDRLQSLPGGWGVMADDVLASVYAWGVLYGLIRLGVVS